MKRMTRLLAGCFLSLCLLFSGVTALSGGFNSDIFASEALHCNGLQISNKKYSQFF